MMAETDGEGLVRVDLEGDSGCARCPSHEVCQAVSREDGAAGGFRGWAFAGAAVGYFLFPLILAGVGAAAGGSQVGQLIGAAAGLGLGMAVAAAVVNRRRASEETAWLRR